MLPGAKAQSDRLYIVHTWVIRACTIVIRMNTKTRTLSLMISHSMLLFKKNNNLSYLLAQQQHHHRQPNKKPARYRFARLLPACSTTAPHTDPALIFLSFNYLLLKVHKIFELKFRHSYYPGMKPGQTKIHAYTSTHAYTQTHTGRVSHSRVQKGSSNPLKREREREREEKIITKHN